MRGHTTWKLQKSEKDFRTAQGALRFPLPPFKGDIAIRVTPLILVH